jgi:hypothetical protein
MMLNHITRILLISLSIVSSATCSAKKMQMAIESVILSADMIVVGEIKSVGIGSYAFSIQETWHGDTALKVIHVEKWKEWTCDARSFEVQKGQRLILLLGKGKSGYYPINASTGEIPVRQDTISSRSGFYEVLPHAVSVEEFGTAVRAIRSCCHITEVNNDLGYFYRWVWDCSADQRSERKAQNSLTAWLFEQMEEREQRQ